MESENIKNWVKGGLNNFNTYLNLIIILPAVLGGLWQLIELSRISFSFIRFFSVTQIIPDGLLVLLILTIFSLSVCILIYLLKKLDSDEETEDDQPEKGNAFLSIIFMVLFFGCIVLVSYCNDYFIRNIESILSLFLYLPINIIITLLAFIFVNYSRMYCKDILALKHLEKIASKIGLIFLIVQGYMFIAFMIQFHNVFLLPAELKNVDNLLCKAEKVDANATFEILYSNDKYIFLRCHKFTTDRNGAKKQSEIRIFKFDELLNDEYCFEFEKEKIELQLERENQIKTKMDKAVIRLDSLSKIGNLQKVNSKMNTP